TRVLGALLENALKFTEEGEIRAAVRISDHELVYEISDTGIGIPESLRDVVFDEFRQADGTITRRHGGAGLGLALSRRIARLLGGDVTLVGVDTGGTCFRFTLPMSGSVSAADAVSPVSASPSVSRSGGHPATPRPST